MVEQFLTEDFLLQTETARILYHEHAKKMPIYDYHCHLPAEEIAALLGTDGRATRMLLDALAAMGYVRKCDGTYENADISRRLLVAGSPFYQGDSLRHRYRLWFRWSALRDVMKTGWPSENLTVEYNESEGQRTKNFTLAMANSGRVRAAEVARALDLSGVRVLLDVGGGPGTYALAFARQFPQLRAVVYDLPEVCAIAQGEIARAGLSERVTTRAGDILVDELGRGYDLIFVSNLVHSYSLAEVRGIFCKAFEALTPGGRVVVKDIFAHEDRSGPLFSLLFAINMLVNTKGGDAYTFSQIEGVLTDAGFTKLKREKLTEQSWMIFGHNGGDS